MKDFVVLHVCSVWQFAICSKPFGDVCAGFDVFMSLSCSPSLKYTVCLFSRGTSNLTTFRCRFVIQAVKVPRELQKRRPNAHPQTVISHHSSALLQQLLCDCCPQKRALVST